MATDKTTLRKAERRSNPGARAPSPAADPSLVSKRVTESIRNLILSGDLPPGSRISQESLAERFGTSRIPVRDALNRLESDGLVLLKPNSGAWVAKLDLSECIEIYKIRERIEPLALSEAVAKMSDEDVDQLAELVTKMAATKDTETFLKLDREFHLASYRASQMEQLSSMVERFWNTTQHYRRAFTKLIGKDGAWIIHAEHNLMIDALRRRDADSAAQMLHEHIRRTRVELEHHTEVFEDGALAAVKTGRSEK